MLGIESPLLANIKERDLKNRNKVKNHEIKFEKMQVDDERIKINDHIKQLEDICGVLEKDLMVAERELNSKLFDIRGRAEKMFKKEKLEEDVQEVD